MVIALAAFAGARLGAGGRPGRGAGSGPRHRSGVAKVLDTSVLIDGRIADVAGAGFLEGPLLVPEFVLAELQAVADAGDTLRRARGKRGFDVLERLRADARMAVEIVQGAPTSPPDVDRALVDLARTSGAWLATTDHNLQRLAEAQGVRVLNVNALALALKLPIAAGESLRVQVLREGRDAGQGVGYLEDGTMVVVDHGRAHMGRVVDVTVTSVLQTAAGRMLFTRIRDAERVAASHA